MSTSSDFKNWARGVKSENIEVVDKGDALWSANTKITESDAQDKTSENDQKSSSQVNISDLAIESIDDGNLDETSDKTWNDHHLNLKQEPNSNHTNPNDLKEETKEVGNYLKGVNHLNRYLNSRKSSLINDLNTRKQQMKWLLKAKGTSGYINNYITTQKGMRRNVRSVCDIDLDKINDTMKFVQLSCKEEPDEELTEKQSPQKHVFQITRIARKYRKGQDDSVDDKTKNNGQNCNRKTQKKFCGVPAINSDDYEELLPGYLDDSQCLLPYGNMTVEDFGKDLSEKLGSDSPYFDQIGARDDDRNELKWLDNFSGNSEQNIHLNNKNIITKIENGGKFTGLTDWNGLPIADKNDFHRDHDSLSKLMENDSNPIAPFEHLGGNDFLRDSHPNNQKDVKNEIEQNYYSSFGVPESTNDPKLLKQQNDEKYDTEDLQDNSFNDSNCERLIDEHFNHDDIIPNYPAQLTEQDLIMQEFCSMDQGNIDNNPMIAQANAEMYNLYPQEMQNCMQPVMFGNMIPPFGISQADMMVKREQGISPFPSYLIDDPYNIQPMSSYDECSKSRASSRPSANKGRKRNKYRMLSVEIKQRAWHYASQFGPKAAAHHLNVPLKSLKRWIKVGCERKKGGGRKTKDPIMEKNLYQWYIDMRAEGLPITAKMIKERAIQLTNCNDFIASKGWLDKFKVRFNLEISKETNKDGGRRKNNYIQSRKIKEKIEDNFNDQSFINNEEALTGYRRSINKSLKQEIKNESYDSLNESSMVKSEYLNDEKTLKEALKPKQEIASIFQKIPYQGNNNEGCQNFIDQSKFDTSSILMDNIIEKDQEFIS